MTLLELPHPWTDALLLSVLALLSLGAGFKRSRWSLVLLALSVVFSAFFVTAGTKLGAVEVVPLALLIGFSVRELMARRRERVIRIPRPLVFVLAGLGVVAVLSSWLAPAGLAGGPGGMQSPSTRPFVQAVSYALMLLFFLIPVWVGIGRRELATLVRGFQGAAVVSAAYGLYQFAAFRLDLPFRGIQYFAEKEGMGLMSVGGIRLFRMSGLSTEPKQLAVISIVAIAMALLSRGIYRDPVRRWGVVLVCGLAFVGAWSTGGMWAAALVLVAGVFWMFSSVREVVPRGVQIAVAGGVVVAAVVLLSGQAAEALSVVQRITFERVEVPGIVEAAGVNPRIENAVLQRFLSQPLKLITGLGLGNYPYVVGARGEWVWAEGIQPMHSLPLTLVADFGVWGLLALGFGILAAIGGSKYRRLQAWLRGGFSGGDSYTVVLAGFIASLLVGVFVSLLPLTLLFMGALYSHHQVVRFGEQPPVKTFRVRPGR